jgi:glycosyltransferase involved in cell wall biosynthesis
VLFGTIGPGMPGGLFITEDAFQRACTRTGRVEVGHIGYGRQYPEEGPLRLALRQCADLVAYAVRLARRRPDVVHLNTAYDRRALGRDLGFAWISAWFGQPLFLKLHGSDAKLLEDHSPFWRWMSRQVLDRAGAIGVLSSEERENFVRAGYDGAKIHVVKNVVDWRRFTSGAWPRQDPTQLLFIARFIPAKGLLDVLRALKLLRDQGRSLHLVCVGDGPQRAEAEALARELGLAAAVRFTGQVSESATTDYYLNSFALVIPTSHPEGFSMTIFQSVAAGLPILTTRIRAAADYLSEPDNVLWVEPHRPERLAERLAWLIDHGDIAAAMSRNNQVRARDFDGERLVDEFVPLYRAIVSTNGRGPEHRT